MDDDLEIVEASDCEHEILSLMVPGLDKLAAEKPDVFKEYHQYKEYMETEYVQREEYSPQLTVQRASRISFTDDDDDDNVASSPVSNILCQLTDEKLLGCQEKAQDPTKLSDSQATYDPNECSEPDVETRIGVNDSFDIIDDVQSSQKKIQGQVPRYQSDKNQCTSYQGYTDEGQDHGQSETGQITQLTKDQGQTDTDQQGMQDQGHINESADSPLIQPRKPIVCEVTGQQQAEHVTHQEVLNLSGDIFAEELNVLENPPLGENLNDFDKSLIDTILSMDFSHQATIAMNLSGEDLFASASDAVVPDESQVTETNMAVNQSEDNQVFSPTFYENHHDNFTFANSIKYQQAENQNRNKTVQEVATGSQDDLPPSQIFRKQCSNASKTVSTLHENILEDDDNISVKTKIPYNSADTAMASGEQWQVKQRNMAITGKGLGKDISQMEAGKSDDDDDDDIICLDDDRHADHKIVSNQAETESSGLMCSQRQKLNDKTGAIVIKLRPNKSSEKVVGYEVLTQTEEAEGKRNICSSTEIEEDSSDHSKSNSIFFQKQSSNLSVQRLSDNENNFLNSNSQSSQFMKCNEKPPKREKKKTFQPPVKGKIARRGKNLQNMIASKQIISESEDEYHLEMSQNMMKKKRKRRKQDAVLQEEALMAQPLKRTRLQAAIESRKTLQHHNVPSCIPDQFLTSSTTDASETEVMRSTRKPRKKGRKNDETKRFTINTGVCTKRLNQNDDRVKETQAGSQLPRSFSLKIHRVQEPGEHEEKYVLTKPDEQQIEDLGDKVGTEIFLNTGTFFLHHLNQLKEMERTQKTLERLHVEMFTPDSSTNFAHSVAKTRKYVTKLCHRLREVYAEQRAEVVYLRRWANDEVENASWSEKEVEHMGWMVRDRQKLMLEVTRKHSAIVRIIKNLDRSEALKKLSSQSSQDSTAAEQPARADSQQSDVQSSQDFTPSQQEEAEGETKVEGHKDNEKRSSSTESADSSEEQLDNDVLSVVSDDEVNNSDTKASSDDESTKETEKVPAERQTSLQLPAENQGTMKSNQMKTVDLKSPQSRNHKPESMMSPSVIKTQPSGKYKSFTSPLQLSVVKAVECTSSSPGRKALLDNTGFKMPEGLPRIGTFQKPSEKFKFNRTHSSRNFGEHQRPQSKFSRRLSDISETLHESSDFSFDSLAFEEFDDEPPKSSKQQPASIWSSSNEGFPGGRRRLSGEQVFNSQLNSTALHSLMTSPLAEQSIGLTLSQPTGSNSGFYRNPNECTSLGRFGTKKNVFQKNSTTFLSQSVGTNNRTDAGWMSSQELSQITGKPCMPASVEFAPRMEPSQRNLQFSQQSQTIPSTQPDGIQKRVTAGLPTSLPSLQEMITAQAIHPGKDVLSLNTGRKIACATLTKDGLIESAGGELFKNPIMWCLALLTSKTMRKSTAYSKVMYKGTRLSDIKIPDIQAQQDNYLPASQAFNNSQQLLGLSNEQQGTVWPKASSSQPSVAEKSATFSRLNFRFVHLIEDQSLLPQDDMLNNVWTTKSSNIPKHLTDWIDKW